MVKRAQVKQPEDRYAEQWDELRESTDFRELFRYRKGDTVKAYQLRPLPTGQAEVWVQTFIHDALTSSRLETTLESPDRGLAFVDNTQKTLEAQGWKKVDARR